jgi:peptide/nickel transport system substrate-binding protein/microcin C transport system substrate-binding protein
MGCQQRPKNNIAFYKNIGAEPSRLNPVGSSDGYTWAVRDYIYETLLVTDKDTNDWKPYLAKSWVVSDDKKVFTYKLREDVTWQDGVQFTAEDVKFSFDILFKDTFNTITTRAFFEGIKEVKVIDKYTVEFIAKDSSYKNFDVIAGTLIIFPKHFYEQKKKKSFFNKNLLGTGAYKLHLYNRGNRIVLIKNEKWWGRNDPGLRDKFNFKKIVLRFVSDSNVSLEMFKKGAFDFIAMNPETYLKKAVGPKWGKSIHKVKVENKAPKGVSFIGWNMKHPILKSRNVRKALYHLINRQLMIEKFEHNYSVPAQGPIYPGSEYANTDIKPIEFDPKLALRILRKEGWRDTDGDNILDKVIDGKKKKLSITIMEPWEGFMKYLTIFIEDAKKAGVEIKVKLIEWNSFVKLLDEKKFDAVRLAWGASTTWDPMQIWHTKSIANGGSNFISFSNKEVDRITDKAKFIHDKAKRIKMLRKAEKIIINEYPYSWFFYKKYGMYGSNDRIKKEVETYNYIIGTPFWKFKSEMRKDI